MQKSGTFSDFLSVLDSQRRSQCIYGFCLHIHPRRLTYSGTIVVKHVWSKLRTSKYGKKKKKPTSSLNYWLADLHLASSGWLSALLFSSWRNCWSANQEKSLFPSSGAEQGQEIFVKKKTFKKWIRGVSWQAWNGTSCRRAVRIV